MKTEKFLKRHFRQLEELLLRAGGRRSKELPGRLLAGDFREVGGPGVSLDKLEGIQTLPEEAPQRLSLHDFHIVVLGRDIVLTTYRATCIGALGRAKHSLRSSIWRQQSGLWRRSPLAAAG